MTQTTQMTGSIFNYISISQRFYCSYDEEKKRWIATHVDHPSFHAISNGGTVLETQEWTIHNDSNLPYSYTAKLSFSSCTMLQFTCSDGNCVDMDKRLVLLQGGPKKRVISFKSQIALAPLITIFWSTL